MTDVFPGGPGTDAGLRVGDIGDVIHAANGSPVGSLLGLRAVLEALSAGDPVVLQVERSGQYLYVTLIIE